MTTLQTDPPMTVEPAACQAEASGRRVACPTCDKTFVASAVVNGHPALIRELGGFVMRRAMFCDHCEQVVKWWEGATDGRPNGVVVGKPSVSRSREKVRRFLKEHPEATGVQQR